MSEEQTTTEQVRVLEKNVISYEPVFPTITARVLLDLPTEDIVEDALAFVDNEQNCSGGFSSLYTNRSIDSLRGVKEIKEAIYGVSCAIAREMKYEVNYDKSSIHVWLEVMRRDNSHDTRTHPRGLFAGQLIVRTEEDYSPIALVNPTVNYRNHEPAIREEDLGPFTAAALLIAPDVNVLNVWPSWMQYKIPPMTAPGPRIAFGFNIDFLPPGA